jgi:hypothetical protein
MVNEQRSGYDGSASAEAPSSPSGASKLSSVSWRSAMEKIRRMLSHRGEKKKSAFPELGQHSFFILFYFKKRKTARDGRNVLLISKLALEGDLVIARNVFDLPRNNSKYDDRVSVTCFYAYNERGWERAYLPDTGVLELLDRFWFALDGSFLLVRQLLCNLRRHRTVGYEYAQAVLL